MTIIDTCIFDFTGNKNLGRAYNEAMERAPEGSHVILRDGDTCWLTPDYGVHVAKYIELYPDDVLTCWTNRINEKAEQQAKHEVTFLDGNNGWCEAQVRNLFDMKMQSEVAINYKQHLYQVTPINGFVSGFCLIVPKKVWEQTKFPEKQMFEDRGPHNLLGVDNYWTNEIRRKGVKVLRCDGLYIWHTYRLLTNSNEHLL